MMIPFAKELGPLLKQSQIFTPKDTELSFVTSQTEESAKGNAYVFVVTPCNSMVAFLCLILCNILYIIYKMYFGPVVTSGTRVGLIYKFLIALLRPRITHHTILHLHLLKRYSVPDVTHGISGILRVYSRHRARTTLDVMR